MRLFDRLDKPVFLKEESDTAKYIAKLKALQAKTSGTVKCPGDSSRRRLPESP